MNKAHSEVADLGNGAEVDKTIGRDRRQTRGRIRPSSRTGEPRGVEPLGEERAGRRSHKGRCWPSPALLTLSLGGRSPGGCAADRGGKLATLSLQMCSPLVDLCGHPLGEAASVKRAGVHSPG